MKKEDSGAARAAGRFEGEMQARLGEHDARFRSIETSTSATATAVANLALQLQRLSDARQADQELVARTAEAVREASKDRAEAAEERAKSSARRQAFVVSMAVVASAVVAVLSFLYSTHVL